MKQTFIEGKKANKKHFESFSNHTERKRVSVSALSVSVSCISMATETSTLKVLLFPWLAYGHIAPFLELAKKLTHRNIHTYICSTPSNLDPIKHKIPSKYSLSIKLIELHLPSLPDLPPCRCTTNGLPLNLHPTLVKALQMGEPEFSKILETLKPQLLIHDTLIQWAAKAADSKEIPSVAFLTFGAATFSYVMFHLMSAEGTEYPFKEIRLGDFEQDMIKGILESVKRDSKQTDEREEEIPSSRIMLIKSSREIEGKYVDLISQLMSHTKIVPVGPLFLTDSLSSEKTDLMEWLDRKGELSTVLVCFGSEYFLKIEEIEEIAHGLELSRVNFIWVLRFPLGEQVDDVVVTECLPRGFLDRIGDRGRVVEKWAPQAEILSHISVGGFVSHCGWSSLLESIEFGVPIVAMPMHLDQPINAKLVVELGVGVEVLRDEKGRWRREEIAKCIRDVVSGERRESLREKVWENRTRLFIRGEEEIEEVAQELAHICGEDRR